MATKSKTTKGKGKQATANRKPFEHVGVIDTIIAECSKPDGTTKSDLFAKLTKKFPERKLSGMRATVHIYLGGRLARDKGYVITHKGDGKDKVYHVVAPKDDATKDRVREAAVAKMEANGKARAEGKRQGKVTKKVTKPKGKPASAPKKTNDNGQAATAA